MDEIAYRVTYTVTETRHMPVKAYEEETAAERVKSRVEGWYPGTEIRIIDVIEVDRLAETR